MNLFQSSRVIFESVQQWRQLQDKPSLTLKNANGKTVLHAQIEKIHYSKLGETSPCG
jgi:hypothetical protein